MFITHIDCEGYEVDTGCAPGRECVAGRTRFTTDAVKTRYVATSRARLASWQGRATTSTRTETFNNRASSDNPYRELSATRPTYESALRNSLYFRVLKKYLRLIRRVRLDWESPYRSGRVGVWCSSAWILENRRWKGRRESGGAHGNVGFDHRVQRRAGGETNRADESGVRYG